LFFSKDIYPSIKTLQNKNTLKELALLFFSKDKECFLIKLWIFFSEGLFSCHDHRQVYNIDSIMVCGIAMN